ncbi:carbohydrate esterase [Lottiidibacillus patelloidae]|uniref:Carbohydrate esterase n=1 Tax=Lottiidibacillus patelloidae TaxID=2670334 RepID=A0A263BT82_9BACI|nr:alpha/beta fold hydrolase [Lottiidibacillus patelloidae]OZM56923.1 carbohydrate esterase [Lottiidibacillus patelloidae]
MLEQFEVFMKSLNRKRMVRVYLPNNYESTNKNYPVLYMHDGQNLFKDEDATYGMSWRISDYLDNSNLEIIVVGIDSNDEGYKRLDEYSPWVSTSIKEFFPEIKEDVGGEGKEYVEFIVQQLKPMIDRKYRTKVEETAMAGSSMGGLISTYAACMYPKVFKRVASVSSAYWFSQQEIEQLLKQSDLSALEAFYLDIGTNESAEEIEREHDIQSSAKVYEIVKDKVKNCTFEIIEGAAHNEKAWRERVGHIFSYLYK